MVFNEKIKMKCVDGVFGLQFASGGG